MDKKMSIFAFSLATIGIIVIILGLTGVIPTPPLTNSISGFIKLCKSENVSEINQTILDMDKNKVLDIYEELSLSFHYKEGKEDFYLEEKFHDKYEALLYMHFGLPYLEQTGQLSFTDEQKARLEDIRFKAGVMLFYPGMKGDVNFNRVKGQYEELYLSKGSTSEAPSGYDSN